MKKIRPGYSYFEIILCGAGLYMVLSVINTILRGGILSARDCMLIFAVLGAASEIFLFTSNAVLVYKEGLRIKNIVGSIGGFLLLSGNLICLPIEGSRMHRPFVLDFVALFICYIDFSLTGIAIMGLIAAKHMPAFDKDFIIIPGCSINKNGGLLPLLRGRTNSAIRFAWDQERATGKAARYIPTGGQGADEIMSEGSAMELYLLSHGAEQYEVFPEKRSRNTFENMLYSREIIDSIKPASSVCFATTNYHVLRSGMLARKAGLNAEGLASSTKWYFWPNGFVRECIAILVMYPMVHLAAALVCIIALM